MPSSPDTGRPGDETIDIGNVPRSGDLSGEDTIAPGEVGTAVVSGLEQFGRYEIVRELGRGGMAVVYEASDTALSRRVALKLLPLQYSSDRMFVERFHREAQAAARLSHPAIISIYDVGEEAGTHYIAMELVDGESLDALKDGGGIEERRLLEICAEVADGLDYAHSQGIVHRDIKPGNIMVDSAGRARITDFGLARPRDAAKLTATGDVLGSPAYMSPEQASGKKVDHRTDIYSLGTVLYEFLCGRPPFTADTTIDLLKKVANRMPSRPRRLKAKMSVKLEAIILKAMEKDAAGRYRDAGRLAADLRAYLAGRPVSVRPPRLLERIDRFARRHKMAMTFMATLSLGVSASYWYVSGYIARMRQRSVLSTAEHLGARRRLAEEKPVGIFSYADNLLAGGDSDGAMSEYTRIVQSSTNGRDIGYGHLKIGSCCELTERTQEAADSYEAAIEAAGNDLPELRCRALYALYGLESSTGDIPSARKGALTMHREGLTAPGVPAPAVLLRNLALRVRNEGKLIQALEIYKDAKESCGNKWRSERISLEIAETMSEKGDLASSLARLNYLSQEAESPDIRGYAAAEAIILLMLSGRNEDARAVAVGLTGKGAADLPPHVQLIASLVSPATEEEDTAYPPADLPSDARNDVLFAGALVMQQAGLAKDEVAAALKKCLASGRGSEWPSRLAARKLRELSKGE